MAKPLGNVNKLLVRAFKEMLIPAELQALYSMGHIHTLLEPCKFQHSEILESVLKMDFLVFTV